MIGMFTAPILPKLPVFRGWGNPAGRVELSTSLASRRFPVFAILDGHVSSIYEVIVMICVHISKYTYIYIYIDICIYSTHIYIYILINILHI